MKDIFAKLSEKLKAFGACAKKYVLSLREDRSKLILTIILAIAIILTCVAVVSFAGKIIGGVSGIFAGDEAKEEEREALPLKEAEEGAEPCVNCKDGYCIHCTNGVIDCPDCEDGVCASCGGQKANQSKFLSLMFDSCLSCSGTGKCKTCDAQLTVDCEYCTDVKCNNCVVQE